MKLSDKKSLGYLLKREDVGAETHALALIAFDGLGDIGNANTAGNGDITELIVVDGDQAGVNTGRLALAVLELQVNGEIVAQSDGFYRGLRLGCSFPGTHALCFSLSSFLSDYDDELFPQFSMEGGWKRKQGGRLVYGDGSISSIYWWDLYIVIR